MKIFWKTVFGSFIGALLAMLVMTLLTFGIIGSIASSGSKETSTAVAPNSVLKIDLSKGFSEKGGESFSFDIISGTPSMGSTMPLNNAVKAIKAAASDPAVSLVYITPAPAASLTVSQIEELRAALSSFRESGKPVVAYCSSMTTGLYYLVSVADKVILNTYGDCMFSGLSSTMFYYKDLIDKLGVDVQLIRHGKYKSAGEPYIKSEMSAENREQYEVMLGTIWNTMAETIASSRDFSAEDLNSWIDNLAIESAEDAKAKGIVDELWYDDQVEEYLCSLVGVEKYKDVKSISLQKYAASKVKPDFRAKDKIAVIYADGEIVMGDKSDGQIGDNFAKEIAKARADSSVKAVVFRVNSPGGSVQASAIIEREIELLKAEKPVIASYGDYAASGGYWISCNCDRIFSNRTTLTGSIGVFGLIPSFGKAIKKNLHLNTFEVSTHKHGNMGDMINPLDADEVAWMQNFIETVYDDFTSRVASARQKSQESVDSIAQGRVWAGGDAIGIGLVDQLGGLEDAIEYAADAVGLEHYQLVTYPAPKTTFEKLMESMNETEVSAAAGTPEAVAERASGRILGLKGSETFALMPEICVNCK